LSSALLNASRQPPGITRAAVGTRLAIQLVVLKLSKTTKKLSIKAESLRRLEERDLGEAQGARGYSYWCSTMEDTKCGWSRNVQCI
jgi:hypothetical protein